MGGSVSRERSSTSPPKGGNDQAISADSSTKLEHLVSFFNVCHCHLLRTGNSWAKDPAGVILSERWRSSNVGIDIYPL